MAYRTLNEVIRDGMELKLECRQCRHTERANPEDLKGNIAFVRRVAPLLGLTDDPDVTLDRCMHGVPCPVCEKEEWAVDVIKPRVTDDD